MPKGTFPYLYKFHKAEPQIFSKNSTFLQTYCEIVNNSVK